MRRFVLIIIVSTCTCIFILFYTNTGRIRILIFLRVYQLYESYPTKNLEILVFIYLCIDIDFAVGAPYTVNSPTSNTGAVYIHYGNRDLTAFTAQAPFEVGTEPVL